jgi:hypothetical protein
MELDEKVKAIYEFVRQNLTWDGVYGYTPVNSNSQVWKDKTGSRAEINLLLINTLQRAGIDAKPALVPSRGSGYPCLVFPMYHLLRDVEAYVDLGKGKSCLLDATDRYLPYNLIKHDVLNNFVYIMGAKKDSAWFNTFDKGSDVVSASIIASVDSTGMVTGTMKESSYNYTAAGRRRAMARRQGEKSEEASATDISNTNNVVILSKSDSADDENNRFYRNVTFSKQLTTDNEGNMYISIPDLFGSQENPFNTKERTSDVDFGTKVHKTTSIILAVPPGYTVDSLRRPVMYINSDTSFRCSMESSFDGENLTMWLKFDTTKSFFRAGMYEDIYEFYQKFYKLLRRPAVIKKKV